MTVQEVYGRLGADYSEIVCRMGNEERVKRFVLKLPQDDSFLRLCGAMTEGNAGEAFREAHTLKGIGLNLGLTNIADKAMLLTEELRAGVINTEAERLFAEFAESYDETIRYIGMLSDAEGIAGEW